ncbi:MAG: DUF2283 domain-containing protein [Nanoarchaeota archaeon]
MNQKLHIHWDPEGDHLEVRFGEAKPSYYEDLGDDVFERRDEETDQIMGYAFFNVQKRKQLCDLEVEMPIAHS